MQLRFHCHPEEPPKALSVLEDAGHTCRWCGFAAMYGMHAYVEDDGPATACSVCHAARHAGVEDVRFRIVWMPEISQPLLSHLGRVIAFARVLSETRRRSGHPPVRPVVDPRLFRELHARGDGVEKACADLLDGSPAKVIPKLPETARTKLLEGLRMLPVAFPTAEIHAWRTDESSIRPYALSALNANRWFVGLLGMRTIHVSGAQDESHEFRFEEMPHAPRT